MKWSIQIVRPSTYNVESTSVLVHFPTGRYLFNCAEGTQRLSFENKVRVSKLSAVFLTRVDWSSMGGLPGMLLTLADSGSRNLTISGGHNLTHALAATRHFILRSEMGIRVNEMRDGDAAAVYKDENLKVTPVHIYPDNYKVTKSELGPDESEDAKTRKTLVARSLGTQQPQLTAAEKRKNKKEASQQQQQQQQKKKGYYDEPCDGASIEQKLQMLERQQLEDARMKKRARSPEQNSRPTQPSDMLLPKTAPSPASICFIAEGPEVPGKFDVQAAKALGLKQGPLYGKLTRGESVTAPDGSIIHPWQCVGPARLSGIFIIIDCPAPAFIDSLVNRPQFAPYLDICSDEKSADLQKRLLLIVHSLGPGVAQDKRYKDWVARFPAHVRHMVSAPEYVPDDNPFQRHLRVQAAMAVIDPATYVLPQSADKPRLPIKSFIDGENAIIPQSLMTFDIEPKPQLDCSKAQKIQSSEAMLKWARDRAGLLDKDLLQPASQPSQDADQKDVAGIKVTSNGASKDELIVCPIGTGSSVPSIYRNVSANIISVKGYGGIVLDCGESTVSLLKRFLGYPERNSYNTRIDLCYTEFVSSLKLLYISHMHADHHLGAILLLHEWNQLTKDLDTKPRLSIVAPARFMAWIEDFSGVQDLGLDRIDFISCHNIRLLHDQGQQSASYFKTNTTPVSANTDANVKTVKRDLGLTDLATCSVIHCPWAYGLSITHESGWKLVYSGDTRPCTNLVTLGRHGDRLPTVLLHEATHSDDLIKDAMAKRHTTVSEAVAMALGMGAENLLMTHFSQRCISLPRWSATKAKEHSVPRYGNLYQYSHGKSSANLSSVEGEEEEEDVSEDVDVDDAPAPLDDAHEAEEALLRELSDSQSDVEDSDSVASEQSQDILDCLNIATAFDMSAYAPSDIARYRFNTRQLRKVLREEIRLFIAEENEAEIKEEIDSGKKSVDTKTSKKKENGAKSKNQQSK
ncbi:hypothetical protein LPJ64_001192 [Coemansia asiatica]|uniref:ribonuclease Z n=1 Tax=Coemansia asiatica TaxID=1052880 RepID=A0A9W8CLP5_9FUNG|nr:hypothetical protein LPJ64_001192 [Coemansia asiatica]